MPATTSQNNAVGTELAAVLPQHNKPWYKESHLLRLNFSIIMIALFSSANGYDGSMMNGLQTLPQWQEFMEYPTGAWLGFINAASSLGAVVGYPISAWCANKIGRKRTIGIGYIFVIVGTILQVTSNSPAQFVISRICIGQASAWWAGAAPLLITEIAYPPHRAILTSMYNCGWYVGSLLAAWITFGTRNYGDSWAWKIPSLAQLFIPAFQFLGYLTAPESPRFLVSKDRVEEARRMLVRFHAGGDEDSELVNFEMAEIEYNINMEKELATSTSYLDMLKTKGNRHRLFITITLGIFGQWNGVGVVSYYLGLVLQTAGITDVTQQTTINGCLQIWNLILAVGGAFMVDRAGRRVLFMTSSLGMLTSYVIISGLSGSFATTGSKATGLAIVPFLFVYYGFYDVAFTPLLISYPAEIWGYQLRARGLATLLVSTQSAVFFNIFINPIALDAIGWKYYIVFAVILVFISLTCYFFYPETRGHALEEMASIFDGEEKSSAPKRGSISAQLNAKRASVSHNGVSVEDYSHVEKA